MRASERDGDWLLEDANSGSRMPWRPALPRLRERESRRGLPGITAFIVERGTDGFQVGREKTSSASAPPRRASSSSRVAVSRTDVLGEAGKGYKGAIETLNEGRIGIGGQ